MFETAMFLDAMEKLCKRCYEAMKAKGFWDGDNDNVPTKIALMHSELSEMLEAYRRGNLITDKRETVVIDGKEVLRPLSIIDRGGVGPMGSLEEEAADLLLRLFDFCGRYGIDLGRVTLAKMHYNESRPHKHGGKVC